jgi:hypothetical protein
VATARTFLGGLADGRWNDEAGALLRALDRPALAGWLVERGLAPLVHERGRAAFADLVPLLRASALATVAGNALHFACLSRVLGAFRDARIPAVLLKGAALARGAYGGTALRPMADVDLWLAEEDLPRAIAILQEMGFRTCARDDRPPALQSLSLGEVQLCSPSWRGGLIELHWSPFPGWWLRRTAAVDHDEIWERAEPVSLDGPETAAAPASLGESRAVLVRQLAAEDTVIQVAVHLAVNSQFGMAPVRGLMDVALAARARWVDWTAVAERAQRWRVGTLVWAVLDLAERLIGLPGAGKALARLRPSRVRRVLLGRLVSPTSLLAARSLKGSRARYLLLLLLVDRPRDGARLVFRSLWPEREWLAARYGGRGSRRRHLWAAVLRGHF